MILKPERYECPEHHIDLTSLVEEEVEFQGGPVIYRPGPRPFKVIVTCDGGGAGAHSLTCTGTQSP